MIADIITLISVFILNIISVAGYAGIFFLMALQSFNIPLPSEVTMIFSGFLVFKGNFNFLAVVLAGASGNLAGSFLSYKLANILTGDLRSRSKILKFLISDINLDLARRWFEKYGGLSVFLGRMIPVISTFISLPAGLAKMNVKKFLLATLSGSIVWSGFLVYLGYNFGEKWPLIITYFRKFDYVVLIVLVLVFVWWLMRHKKSVLER